jgi:hypothetical protein
MRSNLLESVIVTVVQAVEAHCSLDLAKAKYIILRLSMMEKEIVIVQINSSNYGRAIVHAVSRRLPTTAARVRVMWSCWWTKWH